KLTNSVILLRLRDVLDKWLEPSQNAYRTGRNCLQHSVALNTLHHATFNRHFTCFFLFVDFQKAFDSIRRTQLARVLEYFEVPTAMRIYVLTMLQSQVLRCKWQGEL